MSTQNKNTMELNYGMRVQATLTIASHLVPLMGISVHSSSNTKSVICSIEKYWEDDTDANKYKVKLVPVDAGDKLMCGEENYYSSDLKKLIQSGIIKLL